MNGGLRFLMHETPLHITNLTQLIPLLWVVDNNNNNNNNNKKYYLSNLKSWILYTYIIIYSVSSHATLCQSKTIHTLPNKWQKRERENTATIYDHGGKALCTEWVVSSWLNVNWHRSVTRTQLNRIKYTKYSISQVLAPKPGLTHPPTHTQVRTCTSSLHTCVESVCLNESPDGGLQMFAHVYELHSRLDVMLHVLPCLSG